MKKLMVILAILLAASSAYAQGTVPGPSPDWKRYEARPVAPAEPAEAIGQTSLEVGDTFGSLPKLRSRHGVVSRLKTYVSFGLVQGLTIRAPDLKYHQQAVARSQAYKVIRS
jgi:hypothetical protein